MKGKTKEMGKKLAFICDIDNCYTDSREWIKSVPTGTERGAWDEWQRKIHLAQPNQPVINLVNDIVNHLDMEILFITGREDRNYQKEHTIEQLEKFSHGVLEVGKNCHLYMRGNCDYRPAHEVKDELLDELETEYEFVAAIDDDESNCQLYEERNIVSILYDISDESKEQIDKIWKTITREKEKLCK